jgi:hypothetical protein
MADARQSAPGAAAALADAHQSAPAGATAIPYVHRDGGAAAPALADVHGSASAGTAAMADARRSASAGAAPLVEQRQAAPSGEAPSPAPASRTDLWEGLSWAALGATILVLSVQMDRLADQGVPPYAAPGLVPGLLGIVMVLFGGLVALRARRPPSPTPEAGAATPERRPELQPGRLALVIGLCLTFSVVLVGHGLPFWLASSVFVAVSILVLQQPERHAAGRGLDARALIVAAVIGLCAGGAATLVFQRLFLVHLP